MQAGRQAGRQAEQLALTCHNGEDGQNAVQAAEHDRFQVASALLVALLRHALGGAAVVDLPGELRVHVVVCLARVLVAAAAGAGAGAGGADGGARHQRALLARLVAHAEGK
jgi:hypothetical protein